MGSRSSGPAPPPPEPGSDTASEVGIRARATRDAILDTAERLFAERGLFAVSNRQIAQAAGQGNTAVVGYHFGTKTDLVRALVGRFAAGVEQERLRLLTEAEGSADIRDWLGCQVRPVTGRLAALGSPTWYARFAAQVLTDPALRQVLLGEAIAISPTWQRAAEGLSRCLPPLPAEIRQERNGFALSMAVTMWADRERALAAGLADPGMTWDRATAGLIDALAGMWLAPVTATSPPA